MNTITAWFVTPVHKLLAGDINGKTYSPGMHIVQTKQIKDGFMIATKCGNRFTVKMSEMDKYFAKNHHATTIKYLKSMERVPDDKN